MENLNKAEKFWDKTTSFYDKESQKSIKRVNELLKPESFIILATPCIGEKPLLNSLLKFGSKFDIMPKNTSFRIIELEQSIINERFELIETHRLKPKSPLYLLIAKKLKC